MWLNHIGSDCTPEVAKDWVTKMPLWMKIISITFGVLVMTPKILGIILLHLEWERFY